ncbi:MAG: hypothetical protein V2A73_11305, partial [Pseudomonadota bacterium]
DGKLAATSGDDGTVRTWNIIDGRPYWRAPLLLRSPPRLLTHRGWARLDVDEPETSGKKPEEQGADSERRGEAALGMEAPEALSATGRDAAWLRVVADRARIAVQAAGGDVLCVLTYSDEIQLWSMSADRILASVPLESTTGEDLASAGGTDDATRIATAVPRLAATRQGCLVLANGRAFLLQAEAAAPIRELASKASAIAFQADHILVATDKEVLVFDENGGETTNQPVRVAVARGVSALGLAGAGRLLAVGFDAGDIELLPISPATAKPAFSFEEAMPSPVERMCEGPRQTLIVGYASGDLGIWHLDTGKRLRSFKLHGPIVHLLVDNESRRLYAATEVGDYQTIDLSSLFEDYCEVLADVWRRVPVVWQAGVPSLALPPARHRCAAARVR